MMGPIDAVEGETEVAAFASIPVLIAIGYIAVFASVLAFLFWSFGVERLGATRAGQFVNLMPIFGAAIAFPVLGEVPNASQVVGAVLVLGSIALVQRSPARKNRIDNAVKPFGPA
jgi:drug/metabolite transporter (DMT)-like permease